MWVRRTCRTPRSMVCYERAVHVHVMHKLHAQALGCSRVMSEHLNECMCVIVHIYTEDRRLEDANG